MRGVFIDVSPADTTLGRDTPGQVDEQRLAGLVAVELVDSVIDTGLGVLDAAWVGHLGFELLRLGAGLELVSKLLTTGLLAHLMGGHFGHGAEAAFKPLGLVVFC